MSQSSAKRLLNLKLLKSALCLALMNHAYSASAAEGYKLRQSIVGSFGGEIAAPADAPGFFGTVVLTYLDVYKVVDDGGGPAGFKAPDQPLATAAQTGGAVPNGTYKVVMPMGTIDFNQKQTQLNLLGGYLTERKYGGGRIAFSVNVPLVHQSRTFVANQPLGAVTPKPATPPLPAALVVALNAAPATVAAAAQQAVAAGQNANVTGVGDTELSAVWIRHSERLKLAVGASLFVPTGDYDRTRGPQPGFGNFYTLRPGVAVSYALNPDSGGIGWDTGVTLAGRASYGINTTNKDTNYRSGDFVYLEGAIVKVTGNWAWGSNLLAIQQVTNDSGSGVPTTAGRYRNLGIGPFVSYKLPGQDAGFNLHLAQNFGARSAMVARAVQLRFIKAW